MDFVVLGPVQLLGDDGGSIRLASDAQRRLVSVLVLRANTIVRSEVLEEALDLSAGALRTSVSRLRRTVGFDVLVTTAPGYCLRTDRIDVLRFERLVGGVGEATDRRIAIGRLRAALDLWRGQPYEEFAHEPWAQAEVQRLTERRVGAVEHLAALEIERADWSVAIGRLAGLIAEQPFRDEPRRLLMTALAASGRRADALRTFQDYRAFLLGEVGTEPSAEIVALDREIARASAGHERTEEAGLPMPWSSWVGRARPGAAPSRRSSPVPGARRAATASSADPVPAGAQRA